MRLARLLPALEWLPTYGRRQLESDLLAAVIVTVMLIHQSLRLRHGRGLPPYVGLYASMAPLLAYALFGSSRVLAVGPVAVVSLMTAAAVGQVATPARPSIGRQPCCWRRCRGDPDRHGRAQAGISGQPACRIR